MVAMHVSCLLANPSEEEELQREAAESCQQPHPTSDKGSWQSIGMVLYPRDLYRKNLQDQSLVAGISIFVLVTMHQKTHPCPSD